MDEERLAESNGHNGRQSGDSTRADVVSSAAGSIPVALDAELAACVYTVLSSEGGDSRQLDTELTKLESTHGALVYTELLHLLCHLHFDPEEAKRHWRSIVEHRGLFEERLGSYVDLRVALTSYFVQVNRRLENPIVIEMRAFERAQTMAYRDELTGLRNYRFFSECLPQEILRSEQYSMPLSLIMLDVDDFKAYNDRHGHEAGNEVLASIGRLIASCQRQVDIAARYGGEEFALLAPSTPKEGAALLAERVRDRIEQSVLPGEEALGAGRVTVSVGVATYPGDASGAAELLRVADRAMYNAKAAGRNQVRLYKQNRRSHQRVDAALEGSFRSTVFDDYPFRTVNLSAGGLRFVTDQPLLLDSLLDIRLTLPHSEPELVLVGRVVQSYTADEGKSDVAIRIVDMSSQDRRRLIEYLRQREHELEH